MWQVYVKRYRDWVAYGDPMTKEDAQATVAQLQREIKQAQTQKPGMGEYLSIFKGMSEPHCVPV